MSRTQYEHGYVLRPEEVPLGYKWRSKYGGMDASLMKHMKELEDDNRRLKKMYAEEKLKAEIAREAIEKKW